MKFTPETTTLISVGATLLSAIIATGTILFTQNSNIRDEIQTIRDEARGDRADAQAARERHPRRCPSRPRRHPRRR